MGSAVCLALSGCRDSGLDARNYSIGGGFARPASSFPSKPIARLELVRILNSSRGQTFGGLGRLSDASLAENGSVFLTQAAGGPVVVLDSAGRSMREIGEAGSSIKSLLAPSSVALMGQILAVLDERLLEIKVFDTLGTFIRAFRAPAGARYIEPASGNTLVVTVATDTALAYRIDLYGNSLARYRQPQVGSATKLASYVPQPGRLCVRGDHLFFANSWTYEIAAFDLNSSHLDWVVSYPSDVIEPIRTDQGIEQRAALLGLVCTDDLLVLGYLDRKTSIVYYDIFDLNGAPLGRSHALRDSEDLPGFLAGCRGNRIVTFRTRPFQVVSLYQASKN